MIIRGRTTDEHIEVNTVAEAFARITIEAEADMVSISVDANHLQALELAVRAARLELEARAVGP